MTDEIGGGVAPGRRGTTATQTEVRRVPMWVPWDQGGKGAWRLVPADNSHQAQLITEESGVKDAGPLYQKKGFVPEQYAPADKIPALVEKARHAVEFETMAGRPAPKWALGVLGRHPDVGKQKVSAGGSADAA